MPIMLRNGLILTLAAILSISSAQTLNFSSASVPGDWHTEAMYVFKDYVERGTQSEIEIGVFPQGTLFAQGTETAALRRGNLSFAYLSAQDLANQVPEISVMTAGYLIRDPSHLCAVWNGEIGQEFAQKVEEEMDVKLLASLYLGTRQLNLRQAREVGAPSDLDGVTLRMPGSDTWQFLGRALGANPTPLAFGEVYLALQTGTIDAQDNPLSTVVSAKFYEVTEQIVLTNHLVSGPILAVSMDTWTSLTPDQQTIIQDAATAAANFNNRMRILDEGRLVEFLREQGLEISEPDLSAFRETVQAAYLDSPFAADWSEGIVDRINAVEAGPSCQY